jgi:hypothetical protein
MQGNELKLNSFYPLLGSALKRKIPRRSGEGAMCVSQSAKPLRHRLFARPVTALGNTLHDIRKVIG